MAPGCLARVQGRSELLQMRSAILQSFLAIPIYQHGCEATTRTWMLLSCQDLSCCIPNLAWFEKILFLEKDSTKNFSLVATIKALPFLLTSFFSIISVILINQVFSSISSLDFFLRHVFHSCRSQMSFRATRQITHGVTNAISWLPADMFSPLHMSQE